jgi:hypothetical protein
MDCSRDKTGVGVVGLAGRVTAVGENDGGRNGENVGDIGLAVGAKLGALDGIPGTYLIEGDAEGETEGLTDGMKEGEAVGIVVGGGVGFAVGLLEGTKEGEGVGKSVGLKEGL